MSAKILVAEDNEKFAALLKSLLEKSGMQAVVAGDGIEALGIIARQKPDAVLLDLRLPRLSGVDVLKKMRQAEATRHIPVVVLTGAYRGDQNAQALLRLGASAFLEKPCKPSQILSTLNKALPDSKPPAGNRKTVARLLVEAFRNRFSGRLLLTCKGLEHELTLLNGLTVSLSPGFGHPDLGASLLERGIISESDYGYFCQQDKNPELFVRMGLFEYPDLMQARLAYLEKELSAATELVPESVNGEPIAVPAGMQPVTVNLPQILYHGYQQTKKPWQAAGALLDRHAAPSAAYFRFINFLNLTLADRQLLQSIDGSKPVKDCLQDHKNPAPLLRVLTDFGMLQLGQAPLKPADSGEMPLHRLFNRLEEEEVPVEAAEETVSFDDLMDGGFDLPEQQQQAPAPAGPAQETSSVGAEVHKLAEQIKGKNYYEMLGLSQQKFSFDSLKDNYFKLSRQLGPEVIMQLTGEEGAIAQELLADISNAYNTLSDVVKKESYDEMLGSDKIGLGREGDDVFQAEVHFQSGKVFLEMEDWEAAEKALREAYNADQQNGSYLAHLAWATYKNPKHANSRPTLDRAKQMLNKSLTMERSAEGFAYKGWTLIDSNQISLAEAEFTKALKLNARNTLARQGMRAIHDRREAEKKGLFRRMFR